MKTYKTAKDVLPAGQKAVVVFTRGGKLEINEAGSGKTGNWKVNPARLEKVDNVVIYLRKTGQTGGKILIGNYFGYEPSLEQGRLIIFFSHLKGAGSTSSNWREFSNLWQNPVAFMG